MRNARPTDGRRASKRGECPRFLAGALAALLLLPACSVQGPLAQPGGATAGGSDNTARARRLTEALIARDHALDSMRTGAVMEYTSGDQHVKAREEIIVRRPSRLRVEAMSPFGVAVVVVANGPQLEIFQPSDNTLMRGAATAETLNRFAHIPLAPGSAVDLLMALAADDDSLLAHADFAGIDGDMTLVAYHRPDGTGRELGFVHDRLAMVRELDRDGQVRYEVRYSDYRDIGAIMFPYRLEADFPMAGSKVKFSYERPIINDAAPASLFVLTPNPSTRQVTFGRATRFADGASQG